MVANVPLPLPGVGVTRHAAKAMKGWAHFWWRLVEQQDKSYSYFTFPPRAQKLVSFFLSFFRPFLAECLILSSIQSL